MRHKRRTACAMYIISHNDCDLWITGDGSDPPKWRSLHHIPHYKPKKIQILVTFYSKASVAIPSGHRCLILAPIERKLYAFSAKGPNFEDSSKLCSFSRYVRTIDSQKCFLHHWIEHTKLRHFCSGINNVFRPKWNFLFRNQTALEFGQTKKKYIYFLSLVLK